MEGDIAEAAVLAKPVEFFTPDIDRYRESPGLNFDPTEADAELLQCYLGDYKNVKHTEQLARLVIEALDQ